MKTSTQIDFWRGCLGSKDKANFLAFILASTGVSVDSLVQYYQDYSRKRFTSAGKLRTVKDLKDLYGLALRFAAGVSFKPLPYVRSRKNGLPRALGPFEELLNGSPDTKRAALSVLQLYKLIDTKGPHDLSSISKPYGGQSEPIWLNSFREVVLEMFPPSELSNRIEGLQGSLHISGKNGPNGPAMLTVHVDRKAIANSELERDIKMLALITKNDQLNRIMQETDSVCEMEFKHSRKSPTHSRLRTKYEAGGKVRIFAILDTLSQSALKPIHEFFMRWLGSQETDGTNDHAFAANAVREWTSSPESLWSFDLTTATDRYPLFLEEIVVKAAFGDEIAELWKRIINNRQFLVPEGTDMIEFAVGQPLGALSSWAVFSTSHHAHIRTAARLSGYEGSFKDYRIIGDDISIYRDAAVARWYIGMMSDLDVPFSTEKSILPHQCKPNNNCAELAKRVFRNGVEITPVPPDAIIVYMRDPFGKRILIETGIQRGYTRLESPYTVQSFLNNEDYAALTFPLGRTLSLIKGVKVVLSYWTDPCEQPPGGLHPGWAFWETGYYPIPEYGFAWLLKSYLNKQINSAIEQANQYRSQLFELAWSGEIDSKGGDWKPGISEAGQALSGIITYMCQGYGEALLQLSETVEFETLDLYRLIGKLHSFLTPDDLFRRQNFMDEKAKTRVAASNLVKIARRITLNGEESFLRYINE